MLMQPVVQNILTILIWKTVTVSFKTLHKHLYVAVTIVAFFPASGFRKYLFKDFALKFWLNITSLYIQDIDDLLYSKTAK